MRYLAIDFGLRRVGFAICDREHIIVSPLCQIQCHAKELTKTIEQIKIIVNDNDVDAFVVGLPINMDDSEGDQAKVTRQFAQKLNEAIPLPLYFQDERLSSAAADDMLSDTGLSKKEQKQKRDMLAACDILREFLDRQT